MTRSAGSRTADDLEFPDDTARQASMDHAPSGATTLERPVPPEAAAAPLPLVLSADTEEDLRARAAALRDLLAGTGTKDTTGTGTKDTTGTAGAPDPASAALALASRGGDGPHRAVLLVTGRDDALNGLDALAAGEAAPGLTTGTVQDGALAFLFTGQGAQRPRMGAELRAAYPVFAEAFDEVCHVLDPHLPRPLREVIDSGDADLLSRTEYTQPATFAVEVALYWLLESWGVRPDVLAGHSIGEIAAAHAAGVLSLQDAARLVAVRGRLMQALPAGGVMTAALASAADVAPYLEGRTATAGIAAVNGPTSVVLAGAERTVGEIAAELAAAGRKTRGLPVSHAFHSPLMEPVLDDFRAAVADIAFHSPRIPVVSTVTGLPVSPDEMCTPGYWVDHIRATVRFADAMATLEARGTTTYLEVGPDAILTSMGKSCLTPGRPAALLPTMRRARPEAPTLLASLAQAYVRGAHVAWHACFAGTSVRPAELPAHLVPAETPLAPPAPLEK
ncbi:acyltransferase domain-containing protein [Streptomyces nondiastaticus]|uniref:Acyltransferase domain-containing protein n=1 Tax=Streptomyces nondiastaticus TaxID=3154512 RepID=A0ABW6U9H4_9ACTN